MIKHCLFDLDGTLFNTLNSIAYQINRALSSNGVDEITVDETRRFIGNGAEKFVDRIFRSKGIADPLLQKKVLSEYKSAYDSDPLYLTSYYEGIPELIRALRSEGIGLCVLSNKPDVAVKAIVSHFLPEIENARGARDGVPVKPDPTAAIEILSEMGASLESTAVIGDSPEDVYTGINLGAALKIGVSWGFRSPEEIMAAGADTVVNNPMDILREVLDR